MTTGASLLGTTTMRRPLSSVARMTPLVAIRPAVVGAAVVLAAGLEGVVCAPAVAAMARDSARVQPVKVCFKERASVAVLGA